MTISADFRLTQYASGGGCACKIPPGELEQVVAQMLAAPVAPGEPALQRIDADLLIGVENGDDAAVVRISNGQAIVATADFFGPVVDDAYTFGRIAGTNALSDIYAVGGTPLVALNLLGWPRARLPFELAGEVLRGGLDAARHAGCLLAGGHSIDDPEPKYGMAVTGLADPDALLRIDAGRPGLPISLTKPIGSGVLNAWHKATGQVQPQAIEVMTTLNAEASRAALAAGVRCATDVTGFGLLGHLFKLARASGVSAVLDHAAVPLIEGAREAVAGRLRAGRQPPQPRLGRAAHRYRRAQRGGSAAAGGRADLRRPADRRRDPRRPGDRGTGRAAGQHPDPSLGPAHLAGGYHLSWEIVS